MRENQLTYELSENKYSQKGLKLLDHSLKELYDFPYSVKEQIQLAAEAATKLSIQGVQPKLSVVLSVSKKEFEIVEKNRRYILKPPHHLYEEVPQNEDLTMRLADLVGIEVPFHGMIYNKEGSLSYIIRRFDRVGLNKKIGVEDFSQRALPLWKNLISNSFLSEKFQEQYLEIVNDRWNTLSKSH